MLSPPMTNLVCREPIWQEAETLRSPGLSELANRAHSAVP